ncbi:MAG: family 10 glycosylhydrolase [Burkholderiaceae bacterium]|nr:family 10 glycosylhydrolase [Burkholderiaceae bacterium]
MSAMSRRALLAGAASAGLVGCSTMGPPLASPRWVAAPELAALPPPAPREFRAAWVATVANIDWPSRKGLSAAEQQAEVLALLDQAAALKLNAIILQIRTSADALYESALEPWSEYLTGMQGQSPGYDPLALWIAEAHRRGIELHAWFNPFRARQSSATSALAGTHLSQMQPDWVKRYGDQLWIDPGEPGAADHTLAVFMDVLRRYDVDGIHIDDYFYPYPTTDSGPSKVEIDFPDQPSWQRYLAGGGTLARADWRRRNVDDLIARLYRGIRQTKPWVRFGISPFGLPRPDLRPPGISGFSQYHKLYADVERWLAEGWLDYLVPQLYWPIAQKAQAFAPLLEAWHGLNPQGRHVWPGLFTSRITDKTSDKADSWQPDEILNQIALVREQRPGTGHAHFSMVALSQNRKGLADALKAGPYAEPALVPATPWLGAAAPAAPALTLTPSPGGQWHIALSGTATQSHALWLRQRGHWRFMTIAQGNGLLPAAGLDAIVVSAVDRIGKEGPRVGYTLLP